MDELIEGTISLYAAGVGCGVLLSVIPYVISLIMKLALDIMGKGEI